MTEVPETSEELLYHYCSNSVLCSIIENASIWLSSLKLSNDLEEGSWIRTLLAKRFESELGPGYRLGRILSSIDVLINSAEGLGFCLSERGDVLSQWRGYGDDGYGVSIGFRKEFLGTLRADLGKKDLGCWFRKVSYDSLESARTCDSVIENVKDLVVDGRFDPPSFDVAKLPQEQFDALVMWKAEASLYLVPLMLDFFFVKNPSFSEEQEWRLLSFAPNIFSDGIRFRGNRDSVVPYRPYDIPADRGPIGSIILGPRNRSRIGDLRLLLESNGFGNVQIVRSSSTYR